MAAPRKKTGKKVSRPPVKKATHKKVVKKASPKKVVARKTPVKKASSKRPVKKAMKSKGVKGQGLPRDLNDQGFVIGSDTEKIADILLAGGAGRAEINTKVAKVVGKKTRNGNPPNVSSLIANVLRRLQDKGYKIEQTWVLTPPAAGARKKRAKPRK